MLIFSKGAEGSTDFHILKWHLMARPYLKGHVETKAYLLNNRFRLVKTFGNIISGILAHGIDITGVIHAKPSGTSGNLPYLRNIKRAGGNAVILFCLDKTILRTGRFSPIPMASVETTTLVSWLKKRRICLLRISGGRLP